MRGFWNFIWHIPFCGFLLSLLYALCGVLLCCTIILLPVGLKYFEMAKYLLAPFSNALVTEDELSMITGEKAEKGVYSTILRIFYFPFGCVAAVAAVSIMVGEFITLLGIPCALVWGRMLSSIFNPFNKVCVPKDVADEIEKMRSAHVVSKYSGVPAQTSAVVVPSSAGQESSPVRINAAVPRSFSDEKLKGIIDAPEMYNSDLVQQCRREMEIRSNSVVLMAQVRDFSDEKINEILADAVTYSEELVYCCTVEKEVREAKASEAARLKSEEERRRREEEERIEREKRIAWWKKWWWVVALGAVAIISFLCVNGYIQTKKEQERIAEMRRIERERFVADSIEQVRIAEEQEKVEKERAKVAKEQARLEKERAEREKREREERLRQEKELAERKAEEARQQRIKDGVYAVGDPHLTENGVVLWVDASGKHGYLLSKDELENAQVRDGIKWCERKGGWRLPRLGEMGTVGYLYRHSEKDYFGFNMPDAKSAKYYWVKSETYFYESVGVSKRETEKARYTAGKDGSSEPLYIRCVKEF